jgi:hypothetical protein
MLDKSNEGIEIIRLEKKDGHFNNHQASEVWSVVK